MPGRQPPGPTPDGRRPVRRAHPADVEAIEGTDAYRRLAARRRRFTLLAGGIFYALFAAFVGLAAWAHGWMGTRISGGLTVGYLAALVVVVAVWAVVVAYSRAARRVFDPLAKQAQEDRGP